VGIAVSKVLLPRQGTDFSKWAVVACDQYTSEPEYWQQVARTVGQAPSTLELIYPEVFLGEANPAQRIGKIRSTMAAYLEQRVVVEHEGMVYVERQVADKTRRGLVLCVDLERYDYHRGSSSLIRATEGTILDRIPPRVKIREGAALELPHIMVLIDDPGDTVIGPLPAEREQLTQLYDFDLMMDAGHLRGYLVDRAAVEKRVVAALEALVDEDAFRCKYEFEQSLPVLLYAMGDGNHSLATAKAIWEREKERAVASEDVMASPRRYALVELVNVHDEALVFEPIHRVLFQLAAERDLLTEMASFYEGRWNFGELPSLDAMTERVQADAGAVHRIGVVRDAGYGVIDISKPDTNLPVGSLQNFLDKFIDDGGAGSIDYVHGTDTVDTLGRKAGNIGFYLPAMDKGDLFKSVILDGALPRKTFSMGEAFEKRFYVECRELG